MDTFNTLMFFASTYSLSAHDDTESPVNEDSAGQRYGGYCVVAWSMIQSIRIQHEVGMFSYDSLIILLKVLPYPL